MSAKGRTPPVYETWVHVDRFDKPNPNVWAVQYWRHGCPVYRTATHVYIRTAVGTRYHGPKDKQQPRAYLVAKWARVTWVGYKAYIEADPT